MNLITKEKLLNLNGLRKRLARLQKKSTKPKIFRNKLEKIFFFHKLLKVKLDEYALFLTADSMSLEKKE